MLTDSELNNVFADDKLNIKPLILDFIDIIAGEIYQEGKNSKVYSISASFGYGKTFFCEKLKSCLEIDGFDVVKLNIWEMDFYENPLIPLLFKLNELYKQQGKSLPTKLIDTTLNMGTKTISVLGQLVGSIGSNIIKNKIGLDIDPNIWENIKDVYSSQSIYENYKEHHNALSELKTALSDWVKEKHKPIVVIIDELDRCKPDYAIKTLEVLKHFFDISGFVFVLALDEQQLKSSVENLFGSINFDGYKRKFINNTFLLPTPDYSSFSEYLFKKSELSYLISKIRTEKRELTFKIDIYNVFSCAHSYSNYGNETERRKAEDFNKNETSEAIITRYFAAYSEYFSFTLRQMEQIFDRLVLFTKQIANSKEIFSPDLSVFLICLHELDLNIYNSIKNQPEISSSIIYHIDVLKLNIPKDSTLKIKNFNRTIAPSIYKNPTYSFYNNEHRQTISITDNVDRFFRNNDEGWFKIGNALSIGDIKLPNDFDPKEFLKKYCDRMDFIAHFD